MRKLLEIQAKLKAPKNQFNGFGKYKYRSQEDILEALKPLLLEYDCTLTITDNIQEIGNIVMVQAICDLIDNETNKSLTVMASAGVDISKKGMSIEQCFGSASSYARKYALNGLFLIDDTKDADAVNDHAPEVNEEQREYLLRLLENSTYDERQRGQLSVKIRQINTTEAFETAKSNLLGNQLEYHGAVNPGAKEINRELKRKINAQD